MLWYCFALFIAFGLYYFRRNLSSILSHTIPQQLPVIRVVQGRGIIKELKFLPISIPYIDGLYLLYLFQKHGMSLIEHYSRILPPDEDTFSTTLGPFKGILTRDASISSKILNSSEPGHLSRPKAMGIFAPFLRNGLLCSPYEIWVNQRKISARAFTFRCIQSYMDTMDMQSKELAKKMKTMVTDATVDQGGQEIFDCINDAVLRITLEFIMGTSGEISGSEDATQFSKDMFEFIEIAIYRFLHLECYVPVVWWLHPKRRREQFLDKGMLTFVEKVISHYKSKPITDGNEEDERTSKRCLVEEMITFGATPEEIYNEISTFLVVGYDTMISALDLLLHHFACHPGYQERCRNEIDTLFTSNHPDDEIISLDVDVDKISQLEYLDRFIQESLRLTPTVPFTVRDLDVPLKINDKLTLESGQILVTSPWFIHHNPKYYPEPDVFNPDRFLPEEVMKRPTGSYIPFLAGSRNCIGRRFAMLELKTLSAWILRNFELSTEDGLHDVKLFFEATLSPERMYRTKFKMRTFQ